MALAQMTKPRYTGSITFPRDTAYGKIERAVVNVLGGASNARVTIWSFDDVKPGERGEQFDILRHVTVEADGDTMTFTGESYRLKNEAKLADPTMSFTLALNGRCADCGYS